MTAAADAFFHPLLHSQKWVFFFFFFFLLFSFILQSYGASPWSNGYWSTLFSALHHPLARLRVAAIWFDPRQSPVQLHSGLSLQVACWHYYLIASLLWYCCLCPLSSYFSFKALTVSFGRMWCVFITSVFPIIFYASYFKCQSWAKKVKCTRPKSLQNSSDTLGKIQLELLLASS